MIDFYGNRKKEQYIYKRVSWNNWMEIEEYPFITGGSLDFSSESSLKVTGRFYFDGLEIPNTNDLLRVYYAFNDDSGEHVEIPLTTLFVGYNTLEHNSTFSGIKSKGELDGKSPLVVLENDRIELPYVVKRNSNPIYEAQKIVKEHGLNVEYVPSGQVLNADHTWDIGTSYLDIVNWLCNQAGYNQPTPDALGTIKIMPPQNIIYNDNLPTDALVLVNDDKSIMYPIIDVENQIAETPNVLILTYDTEDVCYVAMAENQSGSRVSLDVQGNRRIVEIEDVGELNGNLQTLIEKAESELVKKSADVEIVKLSHAYIPIELYQPAVISYDDMQWVGTIDNYNIDLSVGTKVDLQVKRIVTNNLIIGSEGRIVRDNNA